MQSCQQFSVRSERRSFFDIFCRSLCRQFAKADIFQKRQSEACAMARARERDDGRSHVECLARRAAARIGKGIERYIHVHILVDIVKRHGAHLDLIGTIAERKCPFAQVLRLPRLQHELGVRHTHKERVPEAQHIVGNFCGVIEAAEHQSFMRLPVNRTFEHGFERRIAEV